MSTDPWDLQRIANIMSWPPAGKGNVIREDWRNQKSGSLINILDTRHADYDRPSNATRGRYEVWCESHGESFFVNRLIDARRVAAHSYDWCPECWDKYKPEED